MRKLFLALLFPAALSAQKSAVATAAMTATKAGTITLTVTSGNNQTVNLQSNTTNQYPAAIGLQMDWDLPENGEHMSVNAYFTNTTYALTGAHGGGIAPSLLQMATPISGYQWMTFAQSPNYWDPTVATVLITNTNPINPGLNRGRGTTNYSLPLRINLTGQPDPAADTYAGVLNFKVITQ